MHTLQRVTAFKGPSPLYFCQVLTGWQAAPRSNHECHDFHSGFSDTRPRLEPIQNLNFIYDILCLFVCNRGTQFCVTAGSTLIYISAIEGVMPIPYLLYGRGQTP